MAGTRHKGLTHPRGSKNRYLVVVAYPQFALAKGSTWERSRPRETRKSRGSILAPERNLAARERRSIRRSSR